MPNYTSNSPIIRNYAIVNSDGVTIVRDLDNTDNYYISLDNYAKMAGISIADAEFKARQELLSGGVLFFVEELEGISSRYLVSIASVFRWLLVDNYDKAIILGTDAVTASIINVYEEGSKDTRVDSCY